MTTTIKVNVDDITPSWIKELQQSHKNATLEIKIQEVKGEKQMSENTFWSLINILDWKKGNNTNGIVVPLVAQLKELNIEAIHQFQDILAKKLYQLDKKVFAENLGTYRYGGERNFSVDSFLYARACVVANGKQFYETVLKDPTKMPKEFTFEALLYIAMDAFTQKTGEEWNYLSTPSYETFSNSAGWNGENWVDSILKG